MLGGPSKRDGLSGLIADWGGFEELVAQLHQTGTVTVERNVTLIGRSGAPRQIDVLVRHQEGLYEHKVVVECKYWNSPVERLHVDALATTVQEVGADRGVIFSTHGFQSGAITEAQHQAIRLFKIREPSDEEWGRPGRIVELWLHVIGISVGNPQLHGTHVYGLVTPWGVQSPAIPSLDIRLGDETAPGTPISIDDRPDKTLEAFIERLAGDTARRSYTPVPLRFQDGSFDGEVLFTINVSYEPAKAMRIHTSATTIFVPKMTFQVGVLVSQTRIRMDRGQNLAFFLAVEDCINRTVTAASRSIGERTTVLTPLKSTMAIPAEDVFQNGSLLQAWTKGFQPFTEFAGLEPGKLIEKSKRSPPK